MTIEEAIKCFINFGYYEDDLGVPQYSNYNYKKSEEIIRDALKNGTLTVKEKV